MCFFLFMLNCIFEHFGKTDANNSSSSQRRSGFLSAIKLALYIVIVFVCCCHNTASSIYLQPSSRDIGIWTGDKIFITCFRHPNETEGIVRWIDPNGNEVKELFNEPVYTDQNLSGVKLFFIDAHKRNSGRYKCQYSPNGKETLSTIDFNLHVYNSIDTTGNYNKISVSEGETLSLRCVMRFDVDATDSQINWLYGNINIDKKFIAEKITHRNNERMTVESTLTLRNIKKESAGEYICRGSTLNQYLTDIKQVSIYVRIRFAPYFQSDNSVEEVWVSDKKIDSQPVLVKIECRVNSDPIADFKWTFGDGKFPIDIYPYESNKIHYKTIIPHKTLHNTENINVLTLYYKNLDQIDSKHSYFGSLSKFRCQASNMLGSSEMSYQIKLGQSPIIPTIVEYKYNNGMLTIALNETEIVPPIDLYKLELSDGYAIFFNSTHRLNNGSTYRVAADIPEGQHNLNIYAHNSIGWSQPPAVNYFFAVKLVSRSFNVKHCFTVTAFCCVLSIYIYLIAII